MLCPRFEAPYQTRAGVPRCGPPGPAQRITVGIIEGEERPVARALGIGAGKSRPPGGNARAVATSHSRRLPRPMRVVMGRFDVGGQPAPPRPS